MAVGGTSLLRTVGDSSFLLRYTIHKINPIMMDYVMCILVFFRYKSYKNTIPNRTTYIETKVKWYMIAEVNCWRLFWFYGLVLVLVLMRCFFFLLFTLIIPYINGRRTQDIGAKIFPQQNRQIVLAFLYQKKKKKYEFCIFHNTKTSTKPTSHTASNLFAVENVLQNWTMQRTSVWRVLKIICTRLALLYFCRFVFAQ